MKKAPERIDTARLVLRRPRREDAEAIYAMASDREVTRYMSWPRHRSLGDTEAFLDFSDAQWERWPAGPYVIARAADEAVIGTTGFAFETPERAVTGYLLEKAAWGRGIATEALRAVVSVAATLGVAQLFAACHAENLASVRVLEKGGFTRDDRRRAELEFPNLEPGCRVETLFFVARPVPARK